MIRFLNLTLLSLLLLSGASFAQDKQPLEISASDTLEWHRNINKYIASGDAIATQGDTTIKAEILEAYYREPEKGGMEIWKLIAKGRVEISASNGRATGDHAVYNLDDARAIMTGKALKMDSDGQTLTASEQFEYFTTQNKLIAKGAAKLTRPSETLESDKLTAWFKEGEKSQELDRAEANGNVVITTSEEKITGQNGEYRKADNKAEITGDVKITRGPNVLEGTRAELDLITNISKIFGGQAQTGSDGRVRGTFFPGSESSQ